MKKLLLTLATALLSAGYITAQEMSFTTSKNVGERIQLTIKSDGGFTIEGVEDAAKEGFSGYTLTGQKVTLKGKILEISAVYNSINSVDVSQMPGLNTLDVFGNPIKDIDLSANKELKVLIAGGTELTALDISKCTNLEQLNINSCKIPTMDFTNNGSLQLIFAKSSGFKEINLNGLKSIDVLDCSFNNLRNIDLSVVPTLTQLSCAGNELEELDLSGNELMVLNCNGNKLKTLDLSGQSSLQEVGCVNNNLNTLNLKDCSSLFGLAVYGNDIRHNGMTELVESMPSVFGMEGYFIPVDLVNPDEKNEMSVSNVNKLHEKNWEVYDYDGGSSFDGYGIVYAGEDDEVLSVENAGIAPFTVYATADNIYVNGLTEGTEIIVTDMSGAMINKIVSNGGVNIISASAMPSGVYLVKAGNNSIKVMVR